MDLICGCSTSDKGEMMITQQAPLVAVYINVDNSETEGTGTLSSIVRACDTDVLYQNKTDNLDLAIIPKSFIELNSRRMNYFGK